MSDKLSDVVKRIPMSACCNKSDVYVMCEGRVLRKEDELKSGGVREGARFRSRGGCEVEGGTKRRKGRGPRRKKGQIIESTRKKKRLRVS